MVAPCAEQPPSWADLRKLADAHTVAILAFLIGAPLVLVVASLSTGEPATVALLAQVGISLVMAATLFRLARCLGEPGPLLWAVAPLLHFMLGVLVFAILNMKARRRIGSLGIEVGVLGALVPEYLPEPPAASTSPPDRPGGGLEG